MAKSAAKSASPARKKPALPAEKSSATKSSDEKAEIVTIDDERGKVIEPPPPR
jgi:hypothetical protein